MAFFDRTDMEVYMEAQDIDQIIDGDTTIIPEVIASSEEFVAEKIRQRINVDSEFAKTGNDRNKQLLKQTIAVSLFYLCERLPTENIPEAREAAYERALDWLNDVGSGHRMTTLDKVDEDSKTGYSIRWGSGTLRTNNDLNN